MTYRLKKKKRCRKDCKIEVRLTKELKNKIKVKALLYTDGNISELVLNALEKYVPRREDLEERPRRGTLGEKLRV